MSYFVARLKENISIVLFVTYSLGRIALPNEHLATHSGAWMHFSALSLSTRTDNITIRALSLPTRADKGATWAQGEAIRALGKPIRAHRAVIWALGKSIRALTQRIWTHSPLTPKPNPFTLCSSPFNHSTLFIKEKNC